MGWRSLLRRAARGLLGQEPTSWQTYRDWVEVHPSTIVDPCAQVRVFNPAPPARRALTIGAGSHIFSTFSLLRPTSSIAVGQRCQLGNSSFISAQRIEVGDDVVMAWGCTVIDSDNHSPYWEERAADVERCRRDYLATSGADLARSHDWSAVAVKPVTIGPKCWLGFNVIVLKGVTIGEGCVIGAGSVVTRDVDPWTLGAGNPFRAIRTLPRARPGRP